jgi:hypothetical protein
MRCIKIEKSTGTVSGNGRSGSLSLTRSCDFVSSAHKLGARGSPRMRRGAARRASQQQSRRPPPQRQHVHGHATPGSENPTEASP